MRDDIFAWHFRNASTIDSRTSLLKFQHALFMPWRVWLPTLAKQRLRQDATTTFEVSCCRWSPWPEPSLWRHN